MIVLFLGLGRLFIEFPIKENIEADVAQPSNGAHRDIVVGEHDRGDFRFRQGDERRAEAVDCAGVTDGSAPAVFSDRETQAESCLLSQQITHFAQCMRMPDASQSKMHERII